MRTKGKLLTYLIFAMIVISFLVYGILLGDPQDMRIEASGL